MNLSINGNNFSVNLKTYKPKLSMSNAEMLIHAFMTSMLDYCNAITLIAL